MALILVVALGVAYPRLAYAYVQPVKEVNVAHYLTDLLTTIKSTLTSINTQYLQLKESEFDKVAWITSKIQLAQEASKIVSQIQSGRAETALMLFVQDWAVVGELQRRKAANLFINQLSASKIDPAFKDTLSRSFRTNPYGSESVFNRLRPTFKDDVKSHPGCEDGSCDTKAFLNDFSKGGWLGFQSLTNNPAHNPFTAYNILLQDKLEKEERAKQAALDETRASQGFLGTQDCPPDPETFVGPPAPKAGEEGGPPGPPEPPEEESIVGSIGAALQTARCKITRPGSSIAQDAAQAFGSLHQTLANTDEIFEIIGSLQSIVGSTRQSGFGSSRSAGALQRAQTTISAESVSTATEESDRIIAKAQIVLSSVYNIWRSKEKTLNANAELKATLEKIVANRASCENRDQHDIADNAELSLLDVVDRERTLGKEVGIGGTVGTFAVGGAHSLNLAEKLADVQFLVAIIKNPATLPSDQVSQKLRDVFENPNLPASTDAEARLQEARQRLGGAVAELETAMIPFEGAAQQANAELRQIQSQITQAKSDQRACRII